MNYVSIVLAAGKGTRMKSELPKVLHKVNGVSMVKKVLNVLEKSGIMRNIAVLGHKKEEIITALGDIEYVVQEEQLGTGHAVAMAKEKLIDFDGTVIVLCGDTPLIKSETIKSMIEFHTTNNAAATVLTAEFANPFGYGRIVKDNNGNIDSIIEEKEASDEVKKIKEGNTGFYCFDSKKLFKALGAVTNTNEKGEYYLTDVIKILKNSGEKVEAFKIDDEDEVIGVNSLEQLAQAAKILRKRKNSELMANGVVIVDPATVYIEEEVEIGNDTVIYPNVTIEGKTKIGKKCKIVGNTRIESCIIGDKVEIEASVLEESIVSDLVTIGPFAHLRPKAELGRKVHVGNFVEIKKSILHEGVKAGHLTYIGDSEVGENTNIGAGTITCNYDGKNKFKTEIGKNVFVGSDTKFVAPVKIGDNVLIGAGSVITKDVPEDALAVARAKQIIKEGWTKNR
jgi:bifunctional UDP-N-acetylglucosamine pyrophosphorylase / glucosamine-1-phosphate N-acetyltransferase